MHWNAGAIARAQVLRQPPSGRCGLPPARSRRPRNASQNSPEPPLLVRTAAILGGIAVQNSVANTFRLIARTDRCFYKFRLKRLRFAKASWNARCSTDAGAERKVGRILTPLANTKPSCGNRQGTYRATGSKRWRHRVPGLTFLHMLRCSALPLGDSSRAKGSVRQDTNVRPTPSAFVRRRSCGWSI